MLNLIFDLDGCLIDSSEVQKAAFYGSYKEVVGDDNCPSYEEYIKYTGDSIVNVMKKMGLPVEMVDPYRRISSNSIEKVKINEECVELIKFARGRGNKIAICTGKDHYRVVEILDYFRINDLFDCIVSSDDVEEPKPSAIPVLAAAENMNVDLKSCVVIGDGYNDLLSAKNAGVRSVLTLWYGDEGVVRDCDAVVQTVDELKKTLLIWGL